jgi:hypothetical protein
MGKNTLPTDERNRPIGYLRTFVTLLVLMHHAIIAYLPQTPQPPRSFSQPPLGWTGFPIIDSHKWEPFGLLVGFNDLYFMSLMFFLSGLFVWSSLTRKGAAVFLQNRWSRLGLPFLVSVIFLAPLAYYPAYRLTVTNPDILTFIHTWLALPFWPAGPAWFLWVLLVFTSLAAGFSYLWPDWGNRLARLKLIAEADRYPGRLFVSLILFGALAYIPLSIVIPYSKWVSFGPFTVQGSRFLHYGLYFFVGVVLGAHGVSRGLLASDGKLTQHWKRWGVLPGIGATAMFATLGLAFSIKGIPPYFWEVIGGLVFEFACASACFSLLATFLALAQKPVPLFGILDRSAYGMFLVHYVFNVWLQYALLGSTLPGVIKGLSVFIGVVITSFLTSSFLRKLPGFRRIL